MKTLLMLTVLFAATFATGASAEPPAPRIAAVSAAGLDLGTEQGVRALDLRILHAVSALCGTPSPADPRGRINYERCRDDARATAAAGRDRAITLARGADATMIASNR